MPAQILLAKPSVTQTGRDTGPGSRGSPFYRVSSGNRARFLATVTSGRCNVAITTAAHLGCLIDLNAQPGQNDVQCQIGANQPQHSPPDLTLSDYRERRSKTMPSNMLRAID